MNEIPENDDRNKNHQDIDTKRAYNIDEDGEIVNQLETITMDYEDAVATFSGVLDANPGPLRQET